ncbi:hypothetical protein LXD69_02775 [Flavobacterium sediminilitoris]|uniref:Nuclear transport factor 2 family protein n=1 Tax=Flavobacterium sediminilitoris TaxID=2024526 RepID=A0ABY4HRQ3_9FLAO|nr:MULTISPECIES: hypothetical protein [Flavobacterium]UOX34444.1 hypothetical protein LXD69_02775 [Flavobacterium sediminilitoris]
MKFKILILFLGINLSLFSQNNTDNYKTMLDSAVVIKLNEVYKHYNEELKKDIKTENWKSYISEYKNRLENIYLIDNNHNPFHLDKYKPVTNNFKEINLYEKKNKKILKKGINAWKVSSTLSKNQLSIFIIDFIITYSDGKYNFSNGGGSTIIFKYDCNKMNWELINNTTVGI